MTFTELRYLVAVANERSFGRAAQKCFVSQPALSVAIQKLEEELGARLFERGKNEVTVTPVGERIVEQAQKVLEEMARVREIAQAGPQSAGGRAEARRHLHGGAVPAAGPHPGAARHRAADAARHRGEPDREPRDRAAGPGGSTSRSSRCRSRWRVPRPSSCTRSRSRSWCRCGHKWAKRKSVHPDELAAEHTILLNVGHCFRDQVLDACPELNRADSHVTRTNSLETVRNMVASGLGVSVLPRDALTPKYHSKLVVPVPFARPVPSRRIAVASRKSFPRPEAVAAIREAVALCRAKPD